MIGIVRTTEVTQGLIQDLCRLPQFDAKQDEGTVVHIPPLAHPGEFQTVSDINGCQHFRINKGIHAEVLEEELMFRREVFVIVNAGYGLLRTEGMGQDTGIQVNALLRCHTNKQVSVLHTSVLQSLDARGRSLIGHHVIFAHRAQTLLVIVNQNTVLMLARQQL